MQPSPYNHLKIFRHPEKLEALRSGEITAPISVRIHPTGRCNHDCYYCSYRDENLGLRSLFDPASELSRDLLMSVIDELAGLGVKAVTFSGGGEPLLHPAIEEAMRAVVTGDMDLAILTNGRLLEGEKAGILASANWVRVSMDSPNAATYARIRGIPEAEFAAIVANIRDFAGHKSAATELGVNFVVIPENAGETYDMIRFARELGADHIKVTAMITRDLEKLHEPFRQSVIEQINRGQKEFEGESFHVVNMYETDFDLCTHFQRTYSRCPIQQINSSVGEDGKVYLCHDKAYVPGGELGDLHETGFADIWLSAETRSRFRDFDARKECRHHCANDDRNIFINKFLDLDDQHVNFV